MSCLPFLLRVKLPNLGSILPAAAVFGFFAAIGSAGWLSLFTPLMASTLSLESLTEQSSEEDCKVASNRKPTASAEKTENVLVAFAVQTAGSSLLSKITARKE